MVLNREQLIDHLDSTHLGQGSADMETRIEADPETSQEWKQLRIAVDAVKQAALYEKVSTVRAEWLVRRNGRDTGLRRSARSRGSPVDLSRSPFGQPQSSWSSAHPPRSINIR